MFLELFLICTVLLFSVDAGQNHLAPVVDLGYELYQGYYDEKYKINAYKGIRYASPPVGKLRWQVPQPPNQNRTLIIPALEYAPQCPQSLNSPGPHKPGPSGSEDCLFVNVFTPANKTNLPVMVWIHGGGYGQANGGFDPSPQIYTNDNTYIIVTIQYRLGAFGFLSSADLARSGVPNAGLHDMYFSIQWVQEYIHLFGGDPEQVTIGGESAGGGGAMLLGMAYGGADNTALFKGIIATSPFLHSQWEYDSAMPTEYYYRFAEKVGCLPDGSKTNQSIFQCLVSADTVDLQTASDYVSTTAPHGQWAFLPVTDGTLIQERPTVQLLGGGRLNGMRVLSASNLNDGPDFTPQNITTEDDFKQLLSTIYPLLSKENITNILELYNIPQNTSLTLVNSNGMHPPYSTTNSGWAYGWQQAATNLYAEATFACPSYWLSDAYARKRGGKSWHYQFSVPPGQHGLDLYPLLQPVDTPDTGMDEVFRTALQRIWGNFVVSGNPTLSDAQITTEDRGNISAAGSGVWPRWRSEPGYNWMLNVNMTGGTPTTTGFVIGGVEINVTSYLSSSDESKPPLMADFKVAEGSSWEDGRGKRCQLWADLGPWIKE
ncbi:alpha/beta-hydrolase [Daldinia eschscholtzii]|nr:alpha/beta-hydrolase [Daldinia eschscholtzii]